MLAAVIFGVLMYASCLARPILCDTVAKAEGPICEFLDNTALCIPSVFDWVRGNIWGILSMLGSVQSIAALLVEKTDDEKKEHKDDQ